MKITKEILESTVKEIAKKALPAVVDENFNIEEKEPYELYNAIVGTVFDAAGYNKVATEAPEYLYSHIPGGSKMVGEPKSADITGDEKVDEEDVTAIEELLNKENPTIEDIKTGDVTGDFKLDIHDKKLIEKEAEHQKKSQVKVEETKEETYTITFKDGEEVLKTVSGVTGTPVELPTNLEKEGYTFDGWTIDGEHVILPVTNIGDSDVTYVAKYTEVKPEESESYEGKTIKLWLYDAENADVKLGQKEVEYGTSIDLSSDKYNGNTPVAYLTSVDGEPISVETPLVVNSDNVNITKMSKYNGDIVYYTKIYFNF